MRKLTVVFTMAVLASLLGEGRAQQNTPKIYVLESPPSSRVGLVLKGKYYWFSNDPDECDLKFEGGCFMGSDSTVKQLSDNIISINGGKAFGCSPNIIPDTSKRPGYESGYGKCTSTGWKPAREK